MHFGYDLVLSLIEDFLIVNFVEMFKVDFVFVLDHVVDETVTRRYLFGDRWRHVRNL